MEKQCNHCHQFFDISEKPKWKQWVFDLEKFQTGADKKDCWSQVKRDYATQDQIDRDKERKHIAKLQVGYFFENGKRVELTIKEVGRKFVENEFGGFVIVSYETKDGKLLKYVGSSPLLAQPKWVTVKATIEHKSYNGKDDTLLKRIVIK